MKKRANQPITCASLIAPVSLYSMRASATLAELMVFAVLMKYGLTTPERRMYSVPCPIATCFSPETVRLPLGNTSITVTVECYAERNPADRHVVRVTEATLTYVATDAQRQPRPVPRP